MILPWQHSVWEDLVKRQQTAGLPHALMFTGISGIGKHQLSLHTAEWLLCQRTATEALAQPCGTCHSCQLWRAGTHPDFMICQPEDSSRQIRIDSIRKVNEFLAQTPQISHCQVVILKPVEVMNTNAANALLKTLEEPAGESFLLLEAERFGSVLPTIRSRCQRLQLHAPVDAEASNWLQQQGVSQADAQSALRYNSGAPLAAKSWLEHDGGKQQEMWVSHFKQWTLGSAPLEQVVSVWNKLEIGDVIHWFNTALADALKAQLGVTAEALVYQQLLPELLSSAMLDSAKLITLQRKVQEVQGNLMSGVSHYNKQLLLESLLLDWHAAIRRNPVN